MAGTWTWATVTQASPLRIKVDGDTTPLDATTDNLVGSLAVDDRVRVHLHADGIIVTGLQGGVVGTTEATSATANTLALRDGDGQLKAADGVAADDVATVGQMSAGDTGWLDVTFASGYSTAYASFPVKSRKKNGVVYLRGLASRDAGDFAADTEYSNMFTLHTSCRPAFTQFLAAGTTTSTTGALITVDNTGDVSLRNHTVTMSWLGLYGISFLED